MKVNVTEKVKKQSPMNITKAIKINKEIEKDIADFEKEFPEVDLPKLFREGIYLAMEAVRKGK